MTNTGASVKARAKRHYQLAMRARFAGGGAMAHDVEPTVWVWTTEGWEERDSMQGKWVACPIHKTGWFISSGCLADWKIEIAPHLYACDCRSHGHSTCTPPYPSESLTVACALLKLQGLA